jgi:hypothetical protein
LAADHKRRRQELATIADHEGGRGPAQSASLLTDGLGYVLLRGCTVKLVRTSDGGVTWTTVEHWQSPTRC